MADQFEYLFTPLKIGSVTVKNRLLITAHSTLFSDGDSLFSERDAYYFAERAKGGVGLIITGATSVHPTSSNGRLYPVGYKKEIIPRYRMMAGMVHEHGTKLFVQLRHCGHLTDTGVLGEWRQVWAPSPIPAPGFRETPKEMEIEDIKEIVEAFALCAAYAQEGGADGAEIHGATGYLLQQFMSPLFNKREDEYGGSTENRLRITIEIIHRIRERCGRDFVLGVRICGDEFVPGGLAFDEAATIAQMLEATGKIDFLDVIGSTAHSLITAIAPMDVRPGFLVPLAAGIKQATNGIPVFASGRIVDPVHAENVLADGHGDMIGMTRAHICDPEIGNKARDGRLDEIRNCVGCNIGCRSRNLLHRPITCIQNAVAGREKELGGGTMGLADTRKFVMVVGGGPAGMEAARVAALRGHRVVLYEKDGELGGQVRLAAKVKNREEFGWVARNLILAIARLGVEVRLGEEATPELVRQVGPDVVIIATGSTPLKTGFMPTRGDRPGIPGADQANVITVFDVLRGTSHVGDYVVLVDDEGHQRATSTAAFLADQGKTVEIITRFPTIGFDLLTTNDQTIYYQNLPGKGVTFSPHTVVNEITGKHVVVYTTYTRAERTIEGVDTVVLATGNTPNSELYKALKGQIGQLYAVGDCVEPRRVAEAIYEGHMVGRSI